MNILVVGNGFDLAHELPTKYVDFLAFLDVMVGINNQAGYSIDKIENKAIKKALSGFKDRKNSAPLFEMFFCNICDYVRDNGTCGKVSNERCHFLLKSVDDNKILQHNKWINYFLKKYEMIPGDGWIDIESEIKNVMQFIEKMKKEDVKDARILSLSTNIEDLINVGNNYQANFAIKKKYVKFWKTI